MQKWARSTRQPVILEPREYAKWLTKDERPPVHLLVLPDDDLEIDPVQIESKVKPQKETPEPPMRVLFDGV
jgi:putative SOS response-associated peptidase YedK